ncbi:hypothetical protein [Mesorhizobium sp. M0029]|uniref:hypothetical protein n=1 Tax=Mesorhizobium sp. M0029 TaxID=2956850 RepID=UPI0033382D0F
MVGDTAITGGPIGLRERQFLPKIEVSKNFPGLFAFAGAAELGSQRAREASSADNAEDALRILIEASREVDADFAVALVQKDRPILHRIRSGDATELPTLHIGSPDAFERFQRFRTEGASFAPKAFKHFMCGVAGREVPRELDRAIVAMCELFSATGEHDVGGWATPYLLTEAGAAFCGYVYAVSDPTFEMHQAGNLIGPGTPELGGYTVSVTGLLENDGMVVYTAQRQSGVVVLKNDVGYELHNIPGSPSEFIAAVKSSLGRDASLFIGDEKPWPLRKLRVLQGVGGEIDVVIADHGNAISYSVHNTATEFHHRISLDMSDGIQLPDGVSVTKTSDKAVSLAVGECTIDLHADTLANLVSELARHRTDLIPEVPLKPTGDSIVVINPTWRTDSNIHPGLSGILLNLRHTGHGWLSYMLPHHEAKSLGEWLVAATTVPSVKNDPEI